MFVKHCHVFSVNSILYVMKRNSNSEILGLVNLECLNKQRDPYTRALIDLSKFVKKWPYVERCAECDECMKSAAPEKMKEILYGNSSLKQRKTSHSVLQAPNLVGMLFSTLRNFVKVSRDFSTWFLPPSPILIWRLWQGPLLF